MTCAQWSVNGSSKGPDQVLRIVNRRHWAELPSVELDLDHRAVLVLSLRTTLISVGARWGTRGQNAVQTLGDNEKLSRSSGGICSHPRRNWPKSGLQVARLPRLSNEKMTQSDDRAKQVDVLHWSYHRCGARVPKMLQT